MNLVLNAWMLNFVLPTFDKHSSVYIMGFQYRHSKYQRHKLIMFEHKDEK